MSQIREFLKFCRTAMNISYSQNLQDLWGLWENLDHVNNGFFVEFGALGGINVSNSYLMEQLGWDGIVAEPHPNYRHQVEQNRTCHKCYDAVYSKTGERLVFKIFKGFPARSTLKEFERVDDIKSIDKRSEFREVIVNTISLGDLLDSYNAPNLIDFISIDTEGSEYEILKEFNFNKYRFNCICVEYGTEENRLKIHSLLSSKGYYRKWEVISEHDDWYVLNHTQERVFDLDSVEVQRVLEFEHDLMQRAKKRLSVKIPNLLSKVK